MQKAYPICLRKESGTVDEEYNEVDSAKLYIYLQTKSGLVLRKNIWPALQRVNGWKILNDVRFESVKKRCFEYPEFELDEYNNIINLEKKLNFGVANVGQLSMFEKESYFEEKPKYIKTKFDYLKYYETELNSLKEVTKPSRFILGLIDEDGKKYKIDISSYSRFINGLKKLSYKLRIEIEQKVKKLDAIYITEDKYIKDIVDVLKTRFPKKGKGKKEKDSYGKK